MAKLYTIGCSDLSLEDFVRLLKKYRISTVADVRSVPYSKYTSQFNKEVIKNFLKTNNILYGEFGKEFGARRKELEAYNGSQVSFLKTAELPIFLSGVERIKKGLGLGYSIALMCTEKNPLDCHRFSLVAKGIWDKEKIPCEHILCDGNIKTTDELEQEMIDLFDIQPSLFDDSNQIDTAYNLLNKKIGFVLPETENVSA